MVGNFLFRKEFDRQFIKFYLYEYVQMKFIYIIKKRFLKEKLMINDNMNQLYTIQVGTAPLWQEDWIADK